VHGWIQEKTLPAAGFLPWDMSSFSQQVAKY
jgi:hypothetical protein